VELPDRLKIAISDAIALYSRIALRRDHLGNRTGWSRPQEADSEKLGRPELTLTFKRPLAGFSAVITVEKGENESG
jgi:hypothetical protein